jgi:hypothetical protein
MNTLHVKCSNCNYKSWVEDSLTKFVPENGIYESKLDYLFCESCNKYQVWFLGKGVPNYGELKFGGLTDRFLESKLSIIKRKENRIVELNKKSFPLWRIFTYFKIKNLKKEILNLEEEVSLMNEQIKNSELNSPSIKYYSENKIKPKCLVCSGEKFIENPKHECGGSLFIKDDEDILFTGSVVEEKTLYDEEGYVIKV